MIPRTAPFVLLAVTLSLALGSVWRPACADGGTRSRYERRSQEMPIADSVLDPFAEPPLPRFRGPLEERVPDSVDHAPIDDQGLDAAEREEYERYLVEQGVRADPNDDLRLDRWDGGPASGDAARADEMIDPTEW